MVVSTVTEMIAKCILTEARPDVLEVIKMSNPAMAQMSFSTIFWHWWNILRPADCCDPAKIVTSAWAYAALTGCAPSPPAPPPPTDSCATPCYRTAAGACVKGCAGSKEIVACAADCPAPGQFQVVVDFVKTYPVWVAGLAIAGGLYLAGRIKME